MLLKFSRTGQFLGCSKYPDCKATRPLGSQSRAKALASEHACPKCGKPLLIRQNKRGEKFLSCSAYPDCKESFNIDGQGNPVPSQVETERVCEKCGKPMALRGGRAVRSSAAPAIPSAATSCRWTAKASDANDQDRCEVREMRQANGRARAAAGHSSAALVIPSAAARRPSRKSSRSSLPSLPPLSPANTGGADMKAIEVGETCDDCGSTMVVRRGRRGYFLGCPNTPSARAPRSPARPRRRKFPPSWAVKALCESAGSAVAAWPDLGIDGLTSWKRACREM